MDGTFTLRAEDSNTELLYFDRKLWNDLMKNSEDGEAEVKLEVLKKGFPEIRKADNRTAVQHSKYFKQHILNTGDVLTTNTSGSQDLFVIQ